MAVKGFWWHNLLLNLDGPVWGEGGARKGLDDILGWSSLGWGFYGGLGFVGLGERQDVGLWGTWILDSPEFCGVLHSWTLGVLRLKMRPWIKCLGLICARSVCMTMCAMFLWSWYGPAMPLCWFGWRTNIAIGHSCARDVDKSHLSWWDRTHPPPPHVHHHSPTTCSTKSATTTQHLRFF